MTNIEKEECMQKRTIIRSKSYDNQVKIIQLYNDLYNLVFLVFQKLIKDKKNSINVKVNITEALVEDNCACISGILLLFPKSFRGDMIKMIQNNLKKFDEMTPEEIIELRKEMDDVVEGIR